MTAHLKRHGRVPQLLVIMRQRVLYARLGHQPANPLRLRGPEHEVADGHQRAIKICQ